MNRLLLGLLLLIPSIVIIITTFISMFSKHQTLTESFWGSAYKDVFGEEEPWKIIIRPAFWKIIIMIGSLVAAGFGIYFLCTL